MSIDLAQYPKTENFEIIDTIDYPHSYCITHKHVEYASDNFNGMLGDEAINKFESVQNKGCCGFKNCGLTLGEHKSALLVQINSTEPDLNKIPGLNEYLLSCKEQAIIDNIEGFAFK